MSMASEFAITRICASAVEVEAATIPAKNRPSNATEIHAVLEFLPYLWYPAPPMRDVARVAGDKRVERFSPVRELLDAGILTIAGSDWPVTPSVSPWIGIETLVMRQAPGGAGPVASLVEWISVAQAIDLFMHQAAVALGVAGKRGSIELGKQADLIIIDRDSFTIAVGDIHNVRVLRTIIDDKEVYQAAR